jgi:ubiquinone biosynthesis protein
LGPEARIADELIRGFRLLRRLPDLIRRIDHYYPPPGAAPPAPPLREIAVVRPHRYGLIAVTAMISAAAGAIAVWLLN